MTMRPCAETGGYGCRDQKRYWPNDLWHPSKIAGDSQLFYVAMLRDCRLEREAGGCGFGLKGSGSA